jgi:hypothetical protein
MLIQKNYTYQKVNEVSLEKKNHACKGVYADILSLQNQAFFANHYCSNNKMFSLVFYWMIKI